jgi:hypothetical protein
MTLESPQRLGGGQQTGEHRRLLGDLGGHQRARGGVVTTLIGEIGLHHLPPG